MATSPEERLDLVFKQVFGDGDPSATAVEGGLTAALHKVGTELTSAGEGMETKINQMDIRLTEMTTNASNMQELLQRVFDKDTASKTAKMPFEMTQRRSFNAVEGYNGRREDCENWRFAITGFFEEEPLFVDYVRFLDGVTIRSPTYDYWASNDQAYTCQAPLDSELTDGILKEYQYVMRLTDEQMVWLNANLWSVLRRKLTGQALEVLKSHKDLVTRRGALTWRKLWTDAKGQKGQREGGLVSRVYTPSRATSWSALETTLAAWRNHRAEYLADGKTMEEDAQVNAIKLLVPKELEQLIRDQGDRLNTLADIEKFIAFQLVSRRDPVFGESKPVEKDFMKQLKAFMCNEEESPTAETAENEECSPCGEAEDVLLAFKGFMKGQGKGNKGKGGSFSGECFYCKKPGHRQFECRAREADVLAGRVAPLPAKGTPKGDAGKGGSKGWKGGSEQAGKGGLFSWMEQIIASNASAPTQGTGPAGLSAADKWMSGAMGCIEKKGEALQQASKPRKIVSPAAVATKNQFGALSCNETPPGLLSSLVCPRNHCYEYVPEDFGMPYSKPTGWTAAKAKSDAARL